MILCVCKSVSDSKVHRAVREGRVLALRDLTRELGVGTCCGKCVPAARQVLDSALSGAASMPAARGFGRMPVAAGVSASL